MASGSSLHWIDFSGVRSLRHGCSPIEVARELGSVPKAAELDEAAEARELDERTRETVAHFNVFI